ncbi:hypothetical protein SDC9_131754 [bioreactor metagenome]|uniref:Uncharacterized protein n=1 Tax=bioreactor metagenome TaxID=1076179 RepID=A0A645D610_9ZZZZ
MTPDEARAALEHSHAGGFEQPGDAGAQFVENVVLTLEHGAPVRLDFAGNFNPEISGVARGVKHFGSRNQGFGRDTADIQTGAAEGVLFHQRHFHPLLTGMNRRHITAGTAADDTHIEFFHDRRSFSLEFDRWPLTLLTL